MRTLFSLPLLLGVLNASAQLEFDAKILDHVGLKFACQGTATPILKIRNEGSVAMSGCVVETWKNGVLVNTFDWQLAVPAVQGETRQPVFPDVADVEQGDQLEFRIKTVNTVVDQDPVGNDKIVIMDGEHASTQADEVTIRVTTDDAPEDLTWEIRNKLGQLVASGGPFVDEEAIIDEVVALDPSSCYDFKALDSGRDVISGASIQVLSGPNTLISRSGTDLVAGLPHGLSTGDGSACSQPLVLELRTDDAPEETSWEIIDLSDGSVVCMGGGAYQVASVHTEACCLAEGCYRARVLDSGGDGMTTGGYVLRTADPMLRIIDDRDNFDGAYNGAVSAIAGVAGFCLPLGVSRPIFSSCDKEDWVADKFIVATEDPLVSAQYGVTNSSSGYRFWFFDPNGSYSYRRFRSHATSDGFGSGATRANHFRLNAWVNTPTSPHLPANVLLNVRIASRIAGVDQEWGPACRFKIDPVLAACPRVGLQDNPLSNDFSCGVNKHFGGANWAGNRITATPPRPVPVVSSANVRYQFRFRVPGEAVCIIRPPQTSATFYLNWSATSGPQLQCNTQYEVDVRVSLDGGATWCFDGADPSCVDPVTPWGKVCMVNITQSTHCPGEVTAEGGLQLAQTGTGISLFPNPSDGGAVFLSMPRIDAEVASVAVELFDLSGKRVKQQTFFPDGPLTARLDAAAALPMGVYLVRVTAGERTYTERLVVAR